MHLVPIFLSAVLSYSPPPWPAQHEVVDCPIIATEWRSFTSQKKPIFDLSFSKDRKFLAAGYRDGSFRIWDIYSSELLERRGGTAPAAVLLSGDGKYLMTCVRDRKDCTVRIHGWKRSEAQPRWKYEYDCDVLNMGACLGWSPDGKILALCIRREAMLTLLDAETGEKKGTVAPGGSINAFTFSQKGGLLAVSVSGAKANSIRLWDMKDRKVISEISTVSDASLPVKLLFSGDDRGLAELTNDNRVRLLDASAGGTLRTFKRGNKVLDIAFGVTNELLALEGDASPGALDVWQIATEKRLCRIQVDQSRRYTWQVFSNDASMVAAGTDIGVVSLWKIPSPK